MEYESDILKRLINTYGVVGNPRYISEIIKEFIVRGKERFPELFTYQSDWLAHIDEFGLNPTYTVSYTGKSIYAPNTLERPVKSAILKGKTDENLQSVRMPVLTTSNEDGTKTNTLTTNEEVELRGIGDVKDELNCLTGEVVKRTHMLILPKGLTWRINNMSETNWEFIAKVSYDNKTIPTPYPSNTTSKTLMVDTMFDSAKSVSLADYSPNKDTLSIYVQYEPQNVPPHALTLDAFKNYVDTKTHTLIYKTNENSGKTVELTILDQNGQNVKQPMSFNGGTHFNTGSLEGSPLPSVSVSVETDLEESLKVCSIEGNTI